MVINMPAPKVTILIPSYNQAAYIEQAIRSVLDQDYPALEVFVLDGASTDGSREAIQRYAHRLSGFVSEPDQGQSSALNKGLRLCTGEIWGWLNTDDAYLPGAIREAVRWLAEHPAVDIVYGDCRTIDAAGHILGRSASNEFDARSLLIGECRIPTGSTFLRRSVIERVGRFDESLHYVMDIDYWFRAFPTCAIAHAPLEWSLYRLHSDAKTWDRRQSLKRAEEFTRVYERFWADIESKNPLCHLRTASLANMYLYNAHLAAQSDQRRQCILNLRKALSQGLPAVKPRLLRLLSYLAFGNAVNNFLLRLRAAREIS